MAIRNRGSFQGLEVTVARCELNPAKHIDLYLSEDSITVINDFSLGTASTEAQLVGTLDSEIITGNEHDEWEIISTCFQANGGETFFALVMPLGTFGELPDCVATLGTSGVFRSFYYQLDALTLTPLTGKNNYTIERCRDRDFQVNLVDIVDPNLREGTFKWSDGYEGSTRTLDLFQPYTIEVSLDCGLVPIALEAVPVNCQSSIYVPTAFTPNGDGLNDQFQVEVPPNMDLEQYELQIFTRWGQRIFHSKDPKESWSAPDLALASHALVWHLRFQQRIGSVLEEKTQVGTLMILP